MQSRQVVTARAVIESNNRLPGLKTMAVFAGCAQLAVVLICMAADALCRESEICMVRVPYPDGVPLCRRHVIGGMAPAANHPGMGALKHVARLPVIEFVVAWLPLDDVEVRTEVVRMALGASLIARWVLHDSGVKTSVLSEPLPDFRMAACALELSCSQPEAVARCALRCTFEAGVGLRERSGRNLRLKRQTGKGEEAI